MTGLSEDPLSKAAIGSRRGRNNVRCPILAPRGEIWRPSPVSGPGLKTGRAGRQPPVPIRALVHNNRLDCTHCPLRHSRLPRPSKRKLRANHWTVARKVSAAAPAVARNPGCSVIVCPAWKATDAESPIVTASALTVFAAW